MPLTKTPLALIAIAAVTLTSAHTLAQSQTFTPQVTVVTPPGTNAEVVAVESRIVAPGEIRIGDPIVAPSSAAPQVIVLPPAPPSAAPAPGGQDIHLQIDLRLRIDNPPVAPAAPAAPVAPTVVAPIVTTVARAAVPIQSGLQLQLEQPRRRYGLPIAFMATGAVTAFSGALAALGDEELAFVPAVGAALFATGAVMLIVRIARFARARRRFRNQARITLTM